MQPESPNQSSVVTIVTSPFNPEQTAEEMYAEWEAGWLKQNKNLPNEDNIKQESIDLMIETFSKYAGEEWLAFIHNYLHSDKPHEKYFAARFLIVTATTIAIV